MHLTPEQREYLDSHPIVSGMPERVANLLESRGINTIGDLLWCCPRKSTECNCNNRHLGDIRSLGKKTMEIIYESLESIGFYRRSKRPRVKRRKRRP